MDLIVSPNDGGGNPFSISPFPIVAETSGSQVDHREQLYNQGLTGPITDVQISTDRITKLLGIMFDIDPKLFRTSSVIPIVPTDPNDFYTVVVKPWLSRHPLLNRAEVRCSGTGVHVLLWFVDPPEFTTDEERRRWEGVVLAVQCALPIDPDQPGITAVTRPIGSVNSKNGATVTQFAAGEPVRSDEVLDLYHQLQETPFRTVGQILFGADKVSPCPKCGKPGTNMSLLDRMGQCYGGCGRLQLSDLYNVVLATRDADTPKGADDAVE